MKILDKAKDKFKHFLNHSKKLAQSPKELPKAGQINNISDKNNNQLNDNNKLLNTSSTSSNHPNPQIASSIKKTSSLKLPEISVPKPKLLEEEKNFEEAINNINIDIIHNETPETIKDHNFKTKEEENEMHKQKKYYQPKKMSQGYFSEIEHYLKNKNFDNIADDVLRKDFLNNMKNYHDKKEQGKPFYLHEDDLKDKLRNKMENLTALEEEWHSLKEDIKIKTQRKKELEKGIDSEGTEVKELFKQLKISHLLEQEADKKHYFKLKSGQELKSVNDLRKALTYIKDDEFNHHVSSHKNDFATWIEEALDNREFAHKIRKIKTRKELEEFLTNPI